MVKRLAQQESQIQPTEEKSSNPEIRTSPNFGLPKVFIDGYSLVKVALVDNFVNCSQYVSRSGMTFEGCMVYKNNNNLEDVNGIYYILNSPIYSFHSRRKISRSLHEMKEMIKEIMQSKAVQNLISNQKLLIRYENYHFSVYDEYIKGRMLKFPLQGEQGHLKISWISKLNFQSLQLLQLQFKKVTQLEIYNHSIRFEKEVIEFGMTRFGGDAKLIYNQNDIPISVKLFSPDHGEEAMDLEANQLYLFAHPRPQRQKFID